MADCPLCGQSIQEGAEVVTLADESVAHKLCPGSEPTEPSEPLSSRCMCGGILGSWEEKNHPYPFIFQNVMHAPVGCVRRTLADWEQRQLYTELTGYSLPDNADERTVYSALLGQLKAKRFVAGLVGAVTVMTPLHPPRYSEEIPGNQRGSRRRVYQGTPRAQIPTSPPSSDDPVYRPPWLK